MFNTDTDVATAYTIRRAWRADLFFLNEIERAAARMLSGHAPESVLNEATAIADFETAYREGLLWVASRIDRPVGFAQVKLIELNSAHLDELDVHPDHGRRGLGRQLVGAVCDWAATMGLHAVTLSTFRDVAWNRPFYASMGFNVLPQTQWSEAMARIVDNEERRGLDTTRRVIMQRPSQ